MVKMVGIEDDRYIAFIFIFLYVHELLGQEGQERYSYKAQKKEKSIDNLSNLQPFNQRKTSRNPYPNIPIYLAIVIFCFRRIVSEYVPRTKKECAN